MKTIAIVQARMGSSRLPGKVMAPLLQRPLLAHVLERTARASLVDDVVVATTWLREDDVIANWCAEQGWRVFRGDDRDVLDRYYMAAWTYRAETIVRITGDCPIIDWRLIDQVLQVRRQGRDPADYACNFYPRRTFPRGLDVEAITWLALQRLWRKQLDPRYREHVTLAVYEHPSEWSIESIANTANQSNLRWTVDSAQDLKLAQAIYAHFGTNQFSWVNVIDAYREKPDWLQINADVEQKAA